MKKLVIIGLLLAALVGAGVYGFLIWQEKNALPDQIVVRSLECLRAGDISGLRDCYTEDAWSILAKTVGLECSADAGADISKSMHTLQQFAVDSTTIRGDNAEVIVLVKTATGEESVPIALRRTSKGWRMD